MTCKEFRWCLTVATAGLLVFGAAARSDGVAEGIEWQADSGRVRLAAKELVIAANNSTFTVGAAKVNVHGDPGDLQYWTLEAEWFENGLPMRLFMYFTSDGTDWWVTAIRTYDGTDRGDWVIYEGEFFRAPLGQPFVGDLDVADPDSGCSLRLANLRLEIAP